MSGKWEGRGKSGESNEGCEMEKHGLWQGQLFLSASWVPAVHHFQTCYGHILCAAVVQTLIIGPAAPIFGLQPSDFQDMTII